MNSAAAATSGISSGSTNSVRRMLVSACAFAQAKRERSASVRLGMIVPAA